MVISKDMEVRIKAQLGEGFEKKEVARNLGIHKGTVDRVIERTSHPETKRKDLKQPRATSIDPWRAYIDAKLEKFPKIRATALLSVMKKQGYLGSVYPIRDYCRQKRPRGHQAFLSLRFLPGESAQVDWASFGSVQMGKHKRTLNLFIVVLSYSRKIFAKFYYDMKEARVLEGQALAFSAFNGVVQNVLYDNMKTAVIERVGEAVHFNAGLLEFAAYYNYQPIACNVTSGWEKGRVERAVRYVREGFFEGRQYDGIDDLNLQLGQWLEEEAMERAWVQDSTMTVREAFAQEKLSPLPCEPFTAYEEKLVRVNKYAKIQFDSNFYPVSPDHVGKMLTVRANSTRVKVLTDKEPLHDYPRLWSKQTTLEVPGHQNKIAEKRKIKSHRVARSELERSLACGRELLERWHALDDNLQHSAKSV
jgi:transposase